MFINKNFSKWHKFIPGYKINQGQLSPTPTVDSYIKFSQSEGVSLINKNVLEIGVGATNSTGYEFVSRLGGCYWGYEPFVCFDNKLDYKMKQATLKRFPYQEQDIENKVFRQNELAAVLSQSIDVILSNAVLEHVKDLPKLIKELSRILKEDGCMLHGIDYRDHFFKYPFHFLQFSKKTWNRFLNPGDLFRYRLSDHIKLFNQFGFKVRILKEFFEDKEYFKIKDRLHPDFKPKNKEEERQLRVTTAVIFVCR